MKKCYLGILFISLVILSVDCQRWNNAKPTWGKRTWENTGQSDERNGGSPSPSATKPPTKSREVRGGIGAWGYILIALLLIISTSAIYYTIIFYPIVCKKQRMYHVMGSTTV